MRSTRATVVAITVLLLAPLVAPAGATAQGRVRQELRPVSYFPVQAGNYWVYERRGAAGTSTWRAEVVAEPATGTAGRAMRVDGYFPGPGRHVRVWPLDVVTEVRPEGGRDALWYLLRSPVGVPWTLELADVAGPLTGAECIAGSRLQVASRREVLRVPAGEFSDVVRVEFRPQCSDAGITTEWFAPGVGLIRRDETSLAGSVVSELVESNAGGTWPVRLPFVTSIALDRTVAVNNLMPPVDPRQLPVLKGQVGIFNHTEAPVEMLFNGCRSAAIEVMDAEGEVVLTARADDGGCCTCRTAISVSLVRDALVLPFSLRLVRAGDTPLADGVYAVTATFETAGPPALRPRATTRIEVKSVH